MLSRLHRLALLIATITAPISVAPANAAQDAGAAYHERYQLAGELMRASLVCNQGVDAASFFQPAFALENSADARTFQSLYKDTMAGWMESGAVAFNKRVMSRGTPAACAFAQAERDRALKLAATPLATIAPRPDNQHEAYKRYEIVFQGSCERKLPDGEQFAPCDAAVSFVNYKIGRSAFKFSGDNGKTTFVFEGGREQQLDPQHYKLYVDQAKIDGVAGQSPDAWQSAYGECRMRLNADGSKFFEIGCDIFDPKSRSVYAFHLSPITSFVRKN